MTDAEHVASVRAAAEALNSEIETAAAAGISFDIEVSDERHTMDGVLPPRVEILACREL